MCKWGIIQLFFCIDKLGVKTCTRPNQTNNEWLLLYKLSNKILCMTSMQLIAITWWYLIDVLLWV